mmetsp:Transcript_55637/g.156635  ORF Transcript_55637/g.156635 Transcript_55637/m.156635 type:complete len:405 (-) Transcript_55637:98-1312(-)
MQCPNKVRLGTLLDIPGDAICPISKCVMEDPVVCADGHSYERAFIEQWLACGRRTSPCTNLPLPNANLIPNISLRNVVQELLERMPAIQREEERAKRDRRAGSLASDPEEAVAEPAGGPARAAAAGADGGTTAAEAATALSSMSSIGGMIQTMCAHPGEACVQEAGCAALAAQASNCPANQSAIAAGGGIALIVQAMLMQPSAARIQEEGCKALCYLTLMQNVGLCRPNAVNQRQVAELGGVEVIIKAMGAHVRSAALQQYGCSALMSVVFDHCECQAQALDSGGISAVLRAMDEHPCEPIVQKNGCYALGALARNDIAIGIRISELGGIASVLRAMELHRSRSDVLGAGCMALGELASENALNAALIAKSGGIEAIRKAIHRHPALKGNGVAVIAACQKVVSL